MTRSLEAKEPIHQPIHRASQLDQDQESISGSQQTQEKTNFSIMKWFDEKKKGFFNTFQCLDFDKYSGDYASLDENGNVSGTYTQAELGVAQPGLKARFLKWLESDSIFTKIADIFYSYIQKRSKPSRSSIDNDHSFDDDMELSDIEFVSNHNGSKDDKQYGEIPISAYLTENRTPPKSQVNERNADEQQPEDIKNERNDSESLEQKDNENEIVADPLIDHRAVLLARVDLEDRTETISASLTENRTPPKSQVNERNADEQAEDINNESNDSESLEQKDNENEIVADPLIDHRAVLLAKMELEDRAGTISDDRQNKQFLTRMKSLFKNVQSTNLASELSRISKVAQEEAKVKPKALAAVKEANARMDEIFNQPLVDGKSRDRQAPKTSGQQIDALDSFFIAHEEERKAKALAAEEEAKVNAKVKAKALFAEAEELAKFASMWIDLKNISKKVEAKNIRAQAVASAEQKIATAKNDAITRQQQNQNIQSVNTKTPRNADEQGGTDEEEAVESTASNSDDEVAANSSLSSQETNARQTEEAEKAVLTEIASLELAESQKRKELEFEQLASANSIFKETSTMTNEYDKI